MSSMSVDMVHVMAVVAAPARADGVCGMGGGGAHRRVSQTELYLSTHPLST